MRRREVNGPAAGFLASRRRRLASRCQGRGIRGWYPAYWPSRPRPLSANIAIVAAWIACVFGRVLIVVVYASFTWDHLLGATSGPLWYGICLLGTAALFGREIWMTYRGTQSTGLNLVSAMLAVAASAIILARLVALAR